MKITDSIAALLVGIKNAQMRKKNDVSVPFSNISSDILRIMKQEGFIKGYEEVTTDGKKRIIIGLMYDKQGTPRIHEIRKISKPSIRRYTRYKDITKEKSGYGVTILSTSRGVMSDKEAQASKIGGEMLCFIW